MKNLVPWIIILLFVISVILPYLGPSSETIYNDELQMEDEVIGSHILFRTKDVQEYLNFLDNFDETKYEIVNISTSMHVEAYGNDEFYMITYKVIAE